MQIYRLAKLIILSSIGGIIMILCYEVYEAYKVTNDPPIEIYTHPAYFHLHHTRYSRKEYKWKKLTRDRNGKFQVGEIFAYDYKGTQFLIRVLVDGLTANTCAGVVTLRNKHGSSIMDQIGEEVTEDIYLNYTPSHWLAFLFDKPKLSIGISDIVQNYIPNEKWMAFGNPFLAGYPVSVRARSLDSPSFRINEDKQVYQAFMNQFQSPQLNQLSSEMKYISFAPQSKLAVKYDGREVLLEAGNTTEEGEDFAFRITNAAAPNKWLYEKKPDGNFYYFLEVNDPDVTVIFGDEACTLEQVFNSYIFI